MVTYCGKSCESCTKREEYHCPGCFDICSVDGGCKIAECCRDKGHDCCQTCTQNEYCGLYQSRGSMAREREERRKSAAEKAARLHEIRKVMKKHLLPLFCLSIAVTVTDAASGLFAMNQPVIGAVFRAVLLAAELIYAFLLYRMSPAEKRYLKAARFLCPAAILGFASGILSIFAGNMETLRFFVSLPASILSLIAVYQEYGAHSEVLSDFDDELSEKWDKLRKWYIGLTVGSVLTPFAALFGILGVLIIVAYFIAYVSVSVLSLVFLWRTAAVFNDIEYE